MILSFHFRCTQVKMTNKLTIGGLRCNLFLISSFETFVHCNIIIFHICNISSEAALQRCSWETPMPKCDFNKLLCNFIEVTLRHWCSPVNFLHIFRTPFSKITSGRLLRYLSQWKSLIWYINFKLLFTFVHLMFS